MTPTRFARLKEVLARRQPDLTVLMDNVHKKHNFSAVLRSCDAVGVLEVHGVWPNPKLRPFNVTSGGAGKWVHLRTHPDTGEAVRYLRSRGFQVLAAHPSPHASDFRAVDYTRPSAVLLGAELEGIGEEGLRLADAHVAVPMHGMAASLNVSVAAALILFEAQRQRVAAGLYGHCRLDPATWQRTLFEWAHPQVAEWCRRHERDYPPLDADGAIAGDFRGDAG